MEVVFSLPNQKGITKCFKEDIMFQRIGIVSVIIWALIIASGSSSFTSAFAQCDKDLDEAEQRYNSGRFDEAIQLISGCLEEPGITEDEKKQAYRLLGLTYIAQDYLEEAKAAVRRLLDLIPNYKPDTVQDPPTFTNLVEEVRSEIETKPKFDAEPEPETVSESRTPPSVVTNGPRKTRRFELILNGGYNAGYSISPQSQSYSDEWSFMLLQRIDEQGNFTQELEKPFAFGGAFNFYFAEQVGLQSRLDFNSKAEITGTSDYNLAWTWTSGESFDNEDSWEVTGDASAMVLSGNIVFKPNTKGIIDPVLSGGVSYFTGELKVNTTIGTAISIYDDPTQIIDYFSFPAKIDEQINGVGFNIGGGTDILFSPNVGLDLDLRYFFRSKVEKNWEIVPGEYESEFFNLFVDIDEDAAKEIEEWLELKPFELNPSFFKVSLGLVVMF